VFPEFPALHEGEKTVLKEVTEQAEAEPWVVMEHSDPRKAGSEQEEGFGVQPRTVTDLGMVPNLRRSNSNLCKGRRLQCAFGSSEKVGFHWLSYSDPQAQRGPSGDMGWVYLSLVGVHRVGSFPPWAEGLLTSGVPAQRLCSSHEQHS
jgi:hypothetical protein